MLRWVREEEDRKMAIASGFTVGVIDLEKSSFSGMWGEVCLELAQGEVGREVRAIEYGQLFRVFSRRKMA